METKLSINKNFTTSAGLYIYENLWDKYELNKIFDHVAPKHSGAPTSKIMQNLFFRNFIDANSMVALSEKDKEEYFLQKNASIDRTNYGRNLNKLNDKQRHSILLKFNNGFIRPEDIDKGTIMIYDTSAIKAEGETYENTEMVYDACEEKMIKGYALNKLLLKTKKKPAVIDFKLQNKDKDKTIEMFKKGRRLYGVNKVVIDAGPDIRGMDFYKKLDEEGFLFYTKAVSSWYFNYGKDYTIEQLKEVIKPRLKKQGIVSLEVWKDNMLLRLIFVLNDKRVYLTNDLDIAAGKVVRYYKWRWDIEVSFREEKQNLGLGILPTTKFNGIKTHILLVLLGYILSQLMLAKKKVKRITEGIKLIKRKIIKVFAIIVEKYKKIRFEFESSYKYWWVFDLEFE
ncbi:transposase [bacterium]|nr:transposase [bacterium]